MSTFATKSRTDSTDLADRLSEDLRTAVEAALSRGALLPALLPDVDVRLYTGANGKHHANILLDPYTWDRDDLPQRGNRPLRDAATNRHWYDLSASATDYSKAVDDPTRIRTSPQAADDLLDQVATLLTEIATLRLAAEVRRSVGALSGLTIKP